MSSWSEDGASEDAAAKIQTLLLTSLANRSIYNKLITFEYYASKTDCEWGDPHAECFWGESESRQAGGMLRLALLLGMENVLAPSPLSTCSVVPQTWWAIWTSTYLSPWTYLGYITSAQGGNHRFCTGTAKNRSFTNTSHKSEPKAAWQVPTSGAVGEQVRRRVRSQEPAFPSCFIDSLCFCFLLCEMGVPSSLPVLIAGWKEVMHIMINFHTPIFISNN